MVVLGFAPYFVQIKRFEVDRLEKNEVLYNHQKFRKTEMAKDLMCFPSSRPMSLPSVSFPYSKNSRREKREWRYCDSFWGDERRENEKNEKLVESERDLQFPVFLLLCL